MISTTLEFEHTSDENIGPSAFIIGLIPFLWNAFYYISAIRGQPEFDFSSPGRKLGGAQACRNLVENVQTRFFQGKTPRGLPWHMYMLKSSPWSQTTNLSKRMGFFQEKMIFGSKIRTSWQKISTCRKTKLLNVLDRRQPICFDSVHKQAVTTAQMSSETAPVSEPVYNYSDDKHAVPAAACAESWTPTL